MIERMVDESRKKRAQMAQEETFEPIAIDFGFEDSVAFDSDQEPINFENQGEELCDRDDSSKASATRGVVDDQESCEGTEWIFIKISFFFMLLFLFTQSSN